MPQNIPEETVSFATLEPGEHICSIYKNTDEQISTLVSFFKAGFALNQKGVYVASDEIIKNKLLEEFIQRGVDIYNLIEKGQFEILHSKEIYYNKDIFNPEELYHLPKTVEKKALEQGFACTRAVGEMDWLLRNVPGSERSIEYEANLNKYYSESQVICMCQYDETKFKNELLVEIIHTHRIVILYGKICSNNYYFSPNLYTNENRKSLPATAYDIIKEDLLNQEA
jgi:two-component system, sensor histidine kinase PdtaS